MAITGISSRQEADLALRAKAAAISRERLGRMTLGLVGVALVLATWQLLTVTKVLDPTAVPTMTTTLSRLFQALGTTKLWVGVGQTLEGMAVGFALGSAAGIVIGALLGASSFAYRSSFLVIEFFKTIPVITLLPLAVLLFGTTLKMKVLIVVFGVFFPTVVQTIYGVRSIDPVISDTARAFGLGRRTRFLTVTIPSAAPYLATGLRLGATAALLLDVVAELVAGGSGLGLQILQGEAGGAISYSYALIILTGTIGVLLVIGLTAIERRVLSWHELYRQR
jgi:ABC-type nitrate/sulfonate/bicarbonate transport system permease component